MKSPTRPLAMAAVTFISLSGTAFAKADETTFERDGYTYVYSVKDSGNAHQITGQYFPGGRRFTLNVRNGRVEGVMNEKRVAFALPRAKQGDELASVR